MFVKTLRFNDGALVPKCVGVCGELLPIGGVECDRGEWGPGAGLGGGVGRGEPSFEDEPPGDPRRPT